MKDYKTTNRIYRERDLRLQQEQEAVDRGLRMIGAAMAYAVVAIVMFACYLGFIEYGV
jgi:hypothetical protein